MSKLFLLLLLLIVGPPTHAQTMVQDGPNGYSPDIVAIGGHVYMYSGGWEDVALPGNKPQANGKPQTNDKIYRSHCDQPDHCTLEQSVQFLENGTFTDRPAGTVHINDPSIVDMGDYLLMFMTVCRDAAKCVTDLSVNEIDYAISWANDGLHWTSPVPLLLDAWSPSVMRLPDGSVRLYANTASDGALFHMNLGPSGSAASSRLPVNVGSSVGYQNIEVRYNPALGQYVMVGERRGVGIIDALLSDDGINFSMAWQSIATPVGDYAYVRTPAIGPDGWLYAAATKQPDGTGNQIFAQRKQ